MDSRNYIEFSEDDKNILDQLYSEGIDVGDIINASNLISSYRKVNVQNAWIKVDSKISDNKLKHAFLLSTAAVFLIILSTILITQNSKSISYIAGKESMHLLLNDGSDIILEPHAEITLNKNFSKKNRNVILKGDAYFDISKNKDYPFSIVSQNCEIKVLGTRFFVEQGNGSTIVDLIEGKVSLKDKHGIESTLNPGDKGIVSNNIEIRYDGDQIIENRADKDIYFDNVSIIDAISKLNYIYDREIVKIDDNSSALKEMTIHVRVKNGSVKEFLDIMKILFDVEIYDSNGQFTISAKK